MPRYRNPDEAAARYAHDMRARIRYVPDIWIVNPDPDGSAIVDPSYASS
ncbi:hypothetical protein [Fodinicola feengrottensis]